MVFLHNKKDIFQILRIIYLIYCANLGANDVMRMRKMRNCAQLIFAARKMRKFAPTRKPVALETLIVYRKPRNQRIRCEAVLYICI